MTKSQLTDILRLARVGANILGQNSKAENMVQVWSTIAAAESELAQPETPVEQPAEPHKV